jgi:hypothetical protein
MLINPFTLQNYPMPILIKIEPEEVASKKTTTEVVATLEIDPEPAKSCNETFEVAPANNDTFNVSSANNETIAVAPVTHDSLMTEDNDEDNISMDVPLSLLKQKLPVLPSIPGSKLKKNEVFK